MASGLHSLTNDFEEQLTCVICNDIFTEPRTLPCLHTFCYNCIKRWNESCEREGKRLRCPSCRVIVKIEGGDISKLPSSFIYNSFLQLYKKCLTKAHNSQEKENSEKSVEDAKKLIKEDVDRLNELLVAYNKELELSDENMKRIQSEVATARKKVLDQTETLMKILHDHKDGSIATLDNILVEQSRANDGEKNEVRTNIHQVTELKHQFETMLEKTRETFSSEGHANLQEISKIMLENTSILSTKPIERNSSVCYIPNPEVANVIQKLKIGEVVESVTDPSRCAIESLSNVRCGFINGFKIVTRNTEDTVCYTNKGSLDVQIKDVDGDDVQKEVTETESGRFSVKYKAQKPSLYKVVVTIGGKEIKNSPQNIETIDAKAEFKPLRLIDLKWMTSPVALAVNDGGDIAVVNNNNENDFRVVLFNADGEYLREFGGVRSGDCQLNDPVGVLFNQDQILVSDNDPESNCGYIKEFHVNGTYLRTLCKLPAGMEATGMCRKVNQNISFLSWNVHTDVEIFIYSFAQLNGDHLHDIKLDVPGDGDGMPWSLAYDNNKYFVSVPLRHTVYVFDENGGLLYTIGQEGNQEGQFKNGCGLAVFGKDMLLVCDGDNHRVQVFRQDGQYIKSFGSYGSGAGQMNGPVDIAVAPDGRVFVLECDGKRVQVWK